MVFNTLVVSYFKVSIFDMYHSTGYEMLFPLTVFYKQSRNWIKLINHLYPFYLRCNKLPIGNSN